MNDEPQLLTREDIIEANRAAVKGRYLAALTGQRLCLYTYPKHSEDPRVGCAIGVALTPLTKALILEQDECNGTGNYNAGGVQRLVKAKLVCFPDMATETFAHRLQAKHDMWCAIHAKYKDEDEDVTGLALHSRHEYFEMIGMEDPDGKE